MTAIPCTWCGKPATRMYPGRRRKQRTKDDAYDCYLCPACDAAVRAGKALPAGVSTFSVALKGEQ